MIDINKIVRANIRSLTPYSSARDEYKGKEAKVFLDANENPFNDPYNRYPDPLQMKIKEKLVVLKHVSADQIFFGNGSDEAIDLLIRAFCEPAHDNIVTIVPTYGMYKVCADINNVQLKTVPLTAEFQLDVNALIKTCDNKTKLVYLCSPNNPSGNLLKRDDIISLLKQINGIVVVDEAYIDFAPGATLMPLLAEYNNLVILQTFSKAWGLAGIRLGLAYANAEIISILNKIKYPYNINVLTAEVALKALADTKQKEAWVQTILQQRDFVIQALQKLSFVKKIYPSDANFILVQVDDPRGLYVYLVDKQIIVRDRSKVALCEGCVRITIGTPEENNTLLAALKDYTKV